MRGLWLENRKLTYREDLPMPEPPEGEALIRVRLAGICATDLEMVRGYYPFTGVLGHEFVGEVVRAPSAPEWEGKRVVGEINVTCGHCAQCLAGRPTHCENRTVLGILGRNGVFAEYTTLPVANLLPVPDNVPDEKAVFTEPLAAAMEIQEQVHVHPTDKVLVVGAGRLGQLIAWSLTLTGAEVYAVVRRERQRALLEPYGVTCLTSEEVPHWAMDVVVEATGTPGGLALAKEAVHPRGTIVLKSTYAGEAKVRLSPWVVDEVHVVGSRCGPFAPALRHMEAGRLDPRTLIDAEYPLEEGLAAFEHAAQRGVFKVLLRP
ncbi:MAG: alcohol dehydrogenase catalytic domain-containing protein [Chloroflexi bacterium]|nr:alcohol dehydrogenase catalytic domain-containing protein [Chloroflexota bacterium]